MIMWRKHSWDDDGKHGVSDYLVQHEQMQKTHSAFITRIVHFYCTNVDKAMLVIIHDEIKRTWDLQIAKNKWMIAARMVHVLYLVLSQQPVQVLYLVYSTI